ncbi:integrase arm-type DNA-binding domain-containing protein [Ectothiorhodospira haloalkaliphila]|uniref:tyrosine-type recombinase/integrase n=1 Tax=Ectothiorhodospira haloalkaliphila TaxID=421628 RepID=UPI001EE7D416|nr:site-specific integrase [Ectothiorhodospira haloalkaliphila]MCG5525400.1 integrase arm-type DNA-binding domain-containing protein [Ectothiorhodospira haloalkaliphila]
MGKLTSKKIQQLAKEAQKGMTGDGQGLYLQITASGSASWIYRFKLRGKQRYMGLGSFPEVSLAEARERASDHRKCVKAGIDPMDVSSEEPDTTDTIPSFTSCAARYIMSHRRSWRNIKHARQWVSTLKAYARPVIGEKSVQEVTTKDILKILSPIWTTKTETAKRVQGRIENILDYAAAHNYRDPVNPARWRGHLDKLLAKPSKVRKVAHHPAMPYGEVAGFMSELRENASISSKALQFLILTATRTSEVLHSTWAEIDLDSKTWTIPAERTKAGREHRVPLSRQALTLLHRLPRVKDSPYVFPGARYGRPLSNMAMLQLMRGLGYGPGGERGGYVPHGFRSSFRDWTGEVTSYPRDVAEMALAHAIQNKVEAAYRRGDLFEKRREMMQVWADYLDALKSDEDITDTQPASDHSLAS